MNVAVRANVRTAAAAQRGLNPALRVAFSSGSVMGVTVVGIGLLGVTILYLVFQNISAVAGFGFGASSIALFARVGGGIFTKAADVGSDLVGKVEAGIPEDDPRNPGVIADNVGDNVGDVAGMGADLFESYVGSIISAVALSASAVALAVGSGAASNFTDPQAVFPMLLAGAGILAAILGTFVVRSGEQADFERLLWSLRYGIFTAGGLLIVFAAVLTIVLTSNWYWFGCVVAGLVAGTIIGLATEYYTSYSYKPTQRVSESSQTGAATVIISGIATGMLSTLIPVACISVAILLAYWFAGFYGVALGGRGVALDPGHHPGHRRLWPGGRQCRGHRRAGPIGTAGTGTHRRAGRPGQHHRGHRQGVRHRFRRPDGAGLCWPLTPSTPDSSPSTKAGVWRAMPQGSTCCNLKYWSGW